MKNVVLMLFVSMSFASTLHGQGEPVECIPENIERCLGELGKDSSAVLNSCESTYLDHYFQERRGSFSFKDKKVFFLRGNLGAIISYKKNYFEEIKYALNEGYFPSYYVHQLLIFEDGDREKIGYDATITLGSKRYITQKIAMKYIEKSKKKR